MEKSPGVLTGTVEERYGIGLFLAGRDRAAFAQELASAGPEHRMTLRARGCVGLARQHRYCG